MKYCLCLSNPDAANSSGLQGMGIQLSLHTWHQRQPRDSGGRACSLQSPRLAPTVAVNVVGVQVEESMTTEVKLVSLAHK